MDGGETISPLISISGCLFLSVLYVSSLYVWRSEYNRDHHSTIKKRFFSVFIVMLISPVVLRVVSSKGFLEKTTLWRAMGFRFDGIILAILVPLFLTSILFIGPIYVQIANQAWRKCLEREYWKNCFQDLMWLRNHLVAPLSEEFTFRACMIPILMQSFSSSTVVYITPLFFGVAHFHHLIENIKNGVDIKIAVISSCFQFTYTTIFGLYSAYLFVKTGHFIAPFLAHAFCNHMGFPDVQEIFSQCGIKRYLLLILYLSGLVGWIKLTPLVTEPSWFQNSLY